MIRPAAAIAQMDAYALAETPPGLLSLAQNESCVAPSALAIDAGRVAATAAGPYADPDWTALRRAIGDVHGLDPDAILCGAGSMELIAALIRAFAEPGDAVLASAHGYLFPKTVCAQIGAAYDVAPEADLHVSVDALLDAVRPETRIVFVCNPGNPTGTRLPNRELARLRDALPENVLLVVDQAYGEFDEQDPAPIFELVAHGGAVATRTFSKAYCLADARVGWGVFPPEIGAQVRKVLNPNNVSSVSQAMAAAAMRDRAHLRHVVERTSEIRDRFADRLRRSGVRAPESRTNFLLIPFGSAAEAQRADRALRDGGFLLRGVAGYGLGHCLRATIGDAPAMEAVADILIALREEAA